MRSMRLIGFSTAIVFLVTTIVFLLIPASQEESDSRSNPSLDEMLSGDVRDISPSDLEGVTKDVAFHLKILRDSLEHVGVNRTSDQGSLYKNRFFRTDRSFFLEVERESFPLNEFLRVFAKKSREHNLGKMLIFVSLKISRTENTYRIKKFFVEPGEYSELESYE
jgi:hypothetical protein